MTTLFSKLAIRSLAVCSLTVATVVAAFGSAAHAADTYAVDPVHSSVSFKIRHSGISDIHGRFNDFGGKFTIDKDPAKSSFTFTIKIDSIDTNNEKRDEHLRAPDYFNSKQFPTMTFESTKVKPVSGGYEVTGDVTLHGIKKPATLTLKGGDKVIEFPKGMSRIGFDATFSIKRSEFDLKASLDSLSDEIPISIGVQAVKQ
jgi:polyisoprenoid-binding protein YceI